MKKEEATLSLLHIDARSGQRFQLESPVPGSASIDPGEIESQVVNFEWQRI